MQLGSFRKINLEAKQMITRTATTNTATTSDDDLDKIYYIKVRTDHKKYPWLFLKLYVPGSATLGSSVAFRQLKKMKQECNLVTF